MRNVRNKLLLLILRFLIRYAIYIVDKSKDIDYTWTSFGSGDNFKNYLYFIIDKIALLRGFYKYKINRIFISFF